MMMIIIISGDDSWAINAGTGEYHQLKVVIISQLGACQIAF